MSDTASPPDIAAANQIAFAGSLSEKKALRYTPAGVPVVEGRVTHASEQIEAGLKRKVECELGVVALGETAKLLNAAQPGQNLRITGFLAARSRNSRQPVLHVITIEFLEGNENAQTLWQA